MYTDNGLCKVESAPEYPGPARPMRVNNNVADREAAKMVQFKESRPATGSITGKTLFTTDEREIML